MKLSENSQYDNNQQVIKLLGEDYVIIGVIETPNFNLIYITSKEYIESNGVDLYKPVGIGPILHDFAENTFTQLGVVEYMSLCEQDDYLRNFMEAEEEYVPTLEEIVNGIKKRKYINGEDYHCFMEHHNIDHRQVSISGTKGFTTIESDNNDYLELFRKLLQQVGLPIIECENAIKTPDPFW